MQNLKQWNKSSWINAMTHVSVSEKACMITPGERLKIKKTTQLVWHTSTAFRENALTCMLVSVKAKTRALAWRTKAWETVHTKTNLCMTVLASCFCLHCDLHYTVMSVLTLLQVGAWHFKYGELKSIFNSNINTLKQSNIFDIRALNLIARPTERLRDQMKHIIINNY